MPELCCCLLLLLSIVSILFHGIVLVINVQVLVLSDSILLNELRLVRQLPGASTRARVEEIEKSADRHIGYECNE